MLLSDSADVSELEQLITSLEELQRGDVYLQIREISHIFSDLYTRGAAMMAGPPEPVQQEEHVFVHISDDLITAIMNVIGRENSLLDSLNPSKPVYPKRIIYSIPEKIAEILDKLKSIGTVPVASFFYESGSRTELIATLIAVLELCRVGSVILTGGGDDISITYTGSGRDDGDNDFTQNPTYEV
jgi:segregation and condensation protein A